MVPPLALYLGKGTIPLSIKKRSLTRISSQGVTGKKGGICSEVLDDLKPGVERTDIMNTAPPDLFKSIETKDITSLRENDNLEKDEDGSLFESSSDSFINIILQVHSNLISKNNQLSCYFLLPS